MEEDVDLFFVCYTAICYILWPFGLLVVIWYIFSRFGLLHQ